MTDGFVGTYIYLLTYSDLKKETLADNLISIRTIQK